MNKYKKKDEWLNEWMWLRSECLFVDVLWYCSFLSEVVEQEVELSFYPSLHILSLIGVRNSKESDQFNSIGVGEGRGRGRGGRKSGFGKKFKNVKEG